VPGRFEELDWRETPMGAISLRRRREPSIGVAPLAPIVA